MQHSPVHFISFPDIFCWRMNRHCFIERTQGESLKLLCSKNSQSLLLIVDARLTRSDSSVYYCAEPRLGLRTESCPDLVMRREVNQVCGARQSCSLLADHLTLTFITGGLDRGEDRGEERRRSCHTNSSSVLRTTFACVDQSALVSSWSATTTEEETLAEQPSTQPPLGNITVVQEMEELEEMKEVEKVFSVDKERVIAKPLEPQPGVSSVDSEYLTNILIIITSILTAGLSVLLITILYKLYQTFQTPPASPLNTPVNNFSQYSIHTHLTHLSEMTELTELTEVESQAARLTETGGTWPGGSERRRGVRFEDEAQQHLSVTPLIREQSRVFSSDKLTGDYFLKQEEADKWQFPRVAGSGRSKIGNKYLSL